MVQLSEAKSLKLYLIPGLGADKRMYTEELIKGLNTEVIEWVPPQKTESFKSYIKRITAHIDQSKPFGLVGTSLGGMAAIEAAKFLNPKIVILISSVKTRKELPLWIRLSGRLRLYKLVNIDWFRRAHIFVFSRRLKTKESKAIELALAMAKDASADFIKFGIKSAVNFDNRLPPNSIVHIHGGADRLFPIGRIKNAQQVQGGTHFMVMVHRRKINRMLHDALQQLERAESIL